MSALSRPTGDGCWHTFTRNNALLRFSDLATLNGVSLLVLRAENDQRAGRGNAKSSPTRRLVSGGLRPSGPPQSGAEPTRLQTRARCTRARCRRLAVAARSFGNTFGRRLQVAGIQSGLRPRVGLRRASAAANLRVPAEARSLFPTGPVGDVPPPRVSSGTSLHPARGRSPPAAGRPHGHAGTFQTLLCLCTALRPGTGRASGSGIKCFP